MTPHVKIIVGDCRNVLSSLQPETIHACVTSPPYWKLRDYETKGQLGNEKTIDEYISSLVRVAQCVRRVLRPEGTFWLNLGDCYIDKNRSGCSRSGAPSSKLKYKDAALIPFRAALALQEDGWWVRADNIWHKPDAQPENVDRPNKDHEYIFMLAKSKSPYFDRFSVRQWQHTKAGIMSSHNLRTVWSVNTERRPRLHSAAFPEHIPELCIRASTSEAGCCPKCLTQLKRKVTRTKNSLRSSESETGNVRRTDRRFKGPDGKLDTVKSDGWKPECQCGQDPVPCTVLDPFGGSGTTGVSAVKLGRNSILIELNQKYAITSFRRITEETKDVKIEHQSIGAATLPE